jgi:2-methylcitrate dehydratase PrpD
MDQNIEQKQSLISDALARFVAGYDDATTPAEVSRRAKLLMLDAIGVAYASSRYDFARITLNALREFGAGDSVVIGTKERLNLRDAVLMNSVLVHGIDYDDTYLPGSVHLTASCVPTALGVGAQRKVSGAQLLTAMTLGLELGARLGVAGNGGFLRAGFHATSVLGAFACTLIAGRLMGLTVDQLSMAQGIALSTASGNMQPMQDGSWTKRIHPGWAANGAITAATLAKGGFIGPSAAYEGRFGLYPHFLGQHFKTADLGAITRELGERWEFPRASLKLYPACHQSHAFFMAARKIATEHQPNVDEIESIHALVAEPAVPLICEPAAAKRTPDTSYAAQFSLPYGLACCLTKGRFGLDEIEPAAFNDPALRRLAAKMTYEVDPDPGFPKFRSGEVIVKMKDGRQYRQREAILPDEPAGETEIIEKFMINVEPMMPKARAEALRDAVLNLEGQDAVALSGLLGGQKVEDDR